MTLAELLNAPPKVHDWYSGELTSTGLPTEIFKFMDITLTSSSRSVETGMGISTALFAIKGNKHTCVNPDQGEVKRLKEYAEKNSIALDNMTFIIKRSDEVWFDLKDKIWDLVLIDGCHGFPIPFMDWYFFCKGLALNGHVIIDDTKISTGRRLKEFLIKEDSWKIVAPFSDKTVIFQKIKEFNFNKEWDHQPQIFEETQLLNKGNLVMNFAKKIKNKLKI